MAQPKENSVEDLLKWFEKDLLLRLVGEGKFPIEGSNNSDLEVASVEYEGTERGTDHFASLPFFLKLVLLDRTDSTRTKDFNLVVKFINQKIAVRKAMETDTQFYNEMLFYNEIVPIYENFLRNRPAVPSGFLNSICPVCRYAHIDLNSPDYGIVIMDDLRKDGYACAVSKADLDLNHCLQSVEKLAKFHGISLALKLENPQEVNRLASRFIECRFKDEDDPETDKFYRENGLRAINYLMNKPDSEVPKSYLKLLSEKLEHGIYERMRRFVQPEEPLSVICHGDFCRNNVLYKLENGKAIDCKLFDYQTWRYSSPAVDLTFFIYMNTTLQLRQDHFDEIFDCYYDNLIGTVALITQKPVADLKEKFLRSDILRDYGDHSLYGYAIAAFFLPCMLDIREDAGNFEDEWESMSRDEMLEQNLKKGGEPATTRVAEIIIDMYRRKFYL